jgi:nucleoside recognition membrane protein YjiH
MTEMLFLVAIFSTLLAYYVWHVKVDGNSQPLRTLVIILELYFESLAHILCILWVYVGGFWTTTVAYHLEVEAEIEKLMI